MKPNTSDDQSSEVASEAQKDEEDYSQEEDYWTHNKFYWTQKKVLLNTEKSYTEHRKGFLEHRKSLTEHRKHALHEYSWYMSWSHIYVYILSIECIFFAESDLYIGVSWLNPPTHLYLSRTARNPALSGIQRSRQERIEN